MPVMTSVEGKQWKKDNPKQKHFACKEKGCEFSTASPVELGKHHQENPDHRTETQRAKFLDNQLRREANKRVSDHNQHLYDERMEEKAIERNKERKRLAKNKNQNAKRAAARLEGIPRSDNETRQQDRDARARQTNEARRIVAGARGQALEEGRNPNDIAFRSGKHKEGQTRTLRNHSMRGKDHKHCTNCGGKRMGTFKFCAHCGYKLL